MAKAISVLFHPLFMPFYSFVLAYWLDESVGYFTPKELMNFNYAMVACMTIVFPLISSLILLRGKLISSLEMPLREERTLPYFMTLFYYGLTYFLLQKFPYDPPVLSMLFGAILALLLSAIITTKWKISAHAVGAAGVVATLAGLMFLNASIPIAALVVSVLLLGAVCSARLVLKSHSPAQVYAGAIVGFVPVFLCVVLGWRV